MEKKTTRMADGDWKSAGVRKTMREVEFSNWVDEFMAKERATSSIDYSKPAKLTRPFVVRNVIDDDLNLILPPFEPKNQEKEKEKEKEKKEPDYSKDELNNKINDALLKRKMLAQDEKQLLSQLKRVRARAAEIDNEYRHYQEKLAMIN